MKVFYLKINIRDKKNELCKQRQLSMIIKLSVIFNLSIISIGIKNPANFNITSRKFYIFSFVEIIFMLCRNR